MPSSPFSELAPHIWVAQTSVGWFSCHCIALKGEEAWHIYGAGVNLARDFLEQFGPQTRVSQLIIPNSFHYLGIEEWRAIFPDATHRCSKAAMKRLAAKGVPTPSLIDASLSLPHNSRVLELPHSKIGELWLSFHEQSANRGLCVGDAFFCLDKPKDLRSRLLQKASGICESPAVSRLFKWAMLNDRKKFHNWATITLTELDPQILVPQHGSILQGQELSKGLIRALDQRL